MKISNYQIWQLRQTLRRNWITLVLVLIIPVGFAGLYLYSFGEGLLRDRTKDKVVAVLAPLIDRHLDTFVAQLAPAMRKAGFDPAKFVDESPPGGKQDSPGQTDSFYVIKVRVFEVTTATSKTTLRVFSRTNDLYGSRVERDFAANVIWASTHLFLRMQGQPRCIGIGELLLAAVSRPVQDDNAAKAYDVFSKSPVAKGQEQDKLRNACERQTEYNARSSVIGIDGRLDVEPQQGFVAVGGNLKRWLAHVYNSKSARFGQTRR
jgi:hypothetical protein